MVTGLKPRGFAWVIQDLLAVSERIGGHGVQHRRVRREEEVAWLKQRGINAVLSLLDGNQNLRSYQGAGFRTHHSPLPLEMEPEDVEQVFAAIDEALAPPETILLVHRDLVDDTVAGILAGYLLHSELLEDPIMATAVVQEIVGRPLGPEGRRLIPDPQTG
ncbi:MAG: hypothetical protein ACE5MI_04545 [Acidimicrobiia bacterium]